MSSSNHFKISEEQRTQVVQSISDILKKYALLEQTLRLNADANRSQQEAFFLDLLDVFDALESLNMSVEQSSELAGVGKRISKSLRSIQNKLMAVLAKQDVYPIHHDTVILDYRTCKVIDQIIDSSTLEEKIVSIVRQGFRFEDKVLRPIEVITTKPH